MKYYKIVQSLNAVPQGQCSGCIPHAHRIAIPGKNTHNPYIFNNTIYTGSMPGGYQLDTFVIPLNQYTSPSAASTMRAQPRTRRRARNPRAAACTRTAAFDLAVAAALEGRAFVMGLDMPPRKDDAEGGFPLLKPPDEEEGAVFDDALDDDVDFAPAAAPLPLLTVTSAASFLGVRGFSEEEEAGIDRGRPAGFTAAPAPTPVTIVSRPASCDCRTFSRATSSLLVATPAVDAGPRPSRTGGVTWWSVTAGRWW